MDEKSLTNLLVNGGGMAILATLIVVVGKFLLTAFKEMNQHWIATVQRLEDKHDDTNERRDARFMDAVAKHQQVFVDGSAQMLANLTRTISDLQAAHLKSESDARHTFSNGMTVSLSMMGKMEEVVRENTAAVRENSGVVDRLTAARKVSP